MTLQDLETVLRSRNWATVDDKELKLVRVSKLNSRCLISKVDFFAYFCRNTYIAVASIIIDHTLINFYILYLS